MTDTRHRHISLTSAIPVTEMGVVTGGLWAWLTIKPSSQFTMRV